MRDIFSDLYDRVLSFFNAQTQEETKSIAKNRLKTVLMQDRVGFSERAMQMLKDDMISSISKYLEIDDQSFNLSIDAGENTTILNLSIPVIRPKTDEEIDEALSIAHKEKIEKTNVIVGELKELVKEKAQELAEQITDNDEKIDEENSKEDEIEISQDTQEKNLDTIEKETEPKEDNSLKVSKNSKKNKQ